MIDKILAIENAGSDKTEVELYVSAARHYLRHDRPHFREMLDLLQHSMDKDLKVDIAFDFDTYEIVAVKPLPASMQIAEKLELLSESLVPDKVISPERATELFKMMLARDCVPCNSTGSCIAFKSPGSGCNIRAHMMSYIMVHEGETPKKIWNFGKLHTCSPNAPYCTVGWNYHVAVILSVSQKSGEPLKMVFDPSMFRGPVPVAQWISAQNDPKSLSRETIWQQYERNGGRATWEKADEDMRAFREILDQVCKKHGPPPYDCKCEDEK